MLDTNKEKNPATQFCSDKAGDLPDWQSDEQSI